MGISLKIEGWSEGKDYLYDFYTAGGALHISVIGPSAGPGVGANPPWVELLRISLIGGVPKITYRHPFQKLKGVLYKGNKKILEF